MLTIFFTCNHGLWAMHVLRLLLLLLLLLPIVVQSLSIQNNHGKYNNNHFNVVVEDLSRSQSTYKNTNNNNVGACKSRREWLTGTLLQAGQIGLVSIIAAPNNAYGTTRATVIANNDNNELPSFLRDYTKLAPLGKDNNNNTPLLEGKTTGLSLTELAQRLSHDLTIGSTGQGGYFLTGDLSLDIFQNDCIFEDPTNRVRSLSKYQTALRILFDPKESTVELLPPGLIIDESTNTISGRLRSRGYLQLPWKPYVTAYETNIVYTIDKNTGLIARQDQKWTKSAQQALQETFTPSFFNGPPPKSTLLPNAEEEPRAVTKLFNYINGRRPYEYSTEERVEIENLISEIVASSNNQKNDGNDSGSTTTTTTASSSYFQRNLLPGKWILAYLQPGPNGETIDRRIPFPEFDFNDNFQTFYTANNNGNNNNGIVNTGQLLGPWAYVQVSGNLEEDDPTSMNVPKRLKANITGGKLCVFKSDKYCFALPIQGEGLFDSLYLGERLRIGQNINGGGARIVQIRIG